MNAPSTGLVCLAFATLAFSGCDEPGELAPAGAATEYGSHLTCGRFTPSA